jgi:hypothetical protein
MPVSKHRKKKKQKKSGPPPPKSLAATPKKKLSTQQILIYVISVLVIVSMAIGFLASGGSRRARVQPTPSPQGQNLLLETPVPDDQSGVEESDTTPETTVEPTTEN